MSNMTTYQMRRHPVATVVLALILAPYLLAIVLLLIVLRICVYVLTAGKE